MNVNESFPNIKQTIWLLVLFWLISIGLGVPIEIMGIIGKKLGYSLMSNQIIKVLPEVVAIAIIIKIGLEKNKSSLGETLSFKPIKITLILPLVLIVIGNGIILSDLDNLLQLFLPMPEKLLQIFMEAVNGSFSALIATVIIAPIVEELLFRGLIVGSFLKKYSTKKAIIVSALLFGLFHMNPWQFFSAFIGGILLAWLFVRTRSLLPCIFGHALNNSIPFIVGLLPVKISGFNTVPTAVQFQPLWLDAVGLIIAVVGFLMLIRIFKLDIELLHEGEAVAT